MGDEADNGKDREDGTVEMKMKVEVSVGLAAGRGRLTRRPDCISDQAAPSVVQVQPILRILRRSHADNSQLPSSTLWFGIIPNGPSLSLSVQDIINPSVYR